MIVSCPSCGRSNPPWASHCAKCGAKLDETGPVDARRETATTGRAGSPVVEQAPADGADDKLAPASTAAAARGEPADGRSSVPADRRADLTPADDLTVPTAKPAAGSPWPELPPDALAPFLEPETPGREATVPAGARRTNEAPPAKTAPVRAEKDPLAGLEPLPAPEPRLGVERLSPGREVLAPPPAHPSEPVLPPPSHVEAALGKPAFSDPPLPEPSRLDSPLPQVAPSGHSLRQDPLRQPPLLREPASLARSDPDRQTAGDRELALPSLRADVDVDPAIERLPEFGPALEPDTAGQGAIERFGSARELSAARRFADGAAAAAAAQRVEPTLDPDAVTVTGDPNFPAGDDDPVYGALPPLAGERAGGERTIAPAIQVWSDNRRRRAWRRTGLAIVAIALVLAGGAAAIALIRLTAGDVPASELSVAEVVDRVSARLREFGLLP